MTRTFRTTALVAAFTTLSAPAFAAGGTTPLGDCYNRVIAVCNQGNHPVSCAENAMNACDKQHGDTVAPPEQTTLRAAAGQSVAATFKAATGMSLKRNR